MLVLTSAYAGRIDPATAGFPGGRIKNETTPGVSDDGTPLDRDWANNIEGALQAILDAGNETPNGSIEQVGASQVLDAIQYMIANAGYLNNSVMIGAVEPFARSSAPAGWVEADGGTIGSATSGATSRANADTEDLYTVLWNDFDNATLPIQDSAGSPSTRGASATADFAADKRLPVFDLRGEFIRGLDGGRGVDSGRTLGSAQLDAFQGHKHTGSSVYSTAGGGDGIDSNNEGYGSVSIQSLQTGYGDDGANGTPRTAPETRPRNVALLYCIKY